MCSYASVRSLITDRRLLGSFLFCSLGFSACGGEDASPDGSGGAVDATGGGDSNVSGGAAGVGGASTGGAATGGDSPTASGGDSASGGALASGGDSSTGGSGSSGSGGAEVGSGGDANAAGGAEASGGAGNVGPFQCNQWTGGALMNELYEAGFENSMDGARWQLKWLNSAQVQNWEDPESDWWKAPIESACASGSASPDHVVFMVFSWELKMEADWYESISNAVDTFFNQYPALARLDLMYQVTGPDNTLCPPDPAPETIVVSPELEGAMEQVAADHPGLVFVAPRWAGRSCADFNGGGPHQTLAGNVAALEQITDYLLPDLQ